MNEVNEELEKVLDKHFPKGHKERGKALVLFAQAQCEIEKARKDERERILAFLKDDFRWDNDIVQEAIDTCHVGWSDEDQFNIFVEEVREKIIENIKGDE